jgi:hypothetical protein
MELYRSEWVIDGRYKELNYEALTVMNCDLKTARYED